MEFQRQDAQSASVQHRARAKRRYSPAGIVIALIGLLAVGWLAWHLTHSSGGADGPSRMGFGGRGGPPSTTVGVASAQRADIPITLDALGTVNAAATVTVRAQVSGVLQKILFREGQMVKAGQVLAQIDPRPFEMALMQASGQLRRDEAQLDAARITLERYKTLLSQDSIARQDVDTQAALVKQLEGAVIADHAAEGSAKINLGYTHITAPVAGRVGLKSVDVGNLVSTGDANGVVVITQVSPINVQFTIPQDQVGDIQAAINGGKPMQAVAFDRSRVNVLDTGSFYALDNLVDTQTGTVKAKASFANAKGTMFPSQFVNLRLQINTIKGAVVVPVNALRHGSKGDFVYVLDAPNRTVSQRMVTRGHAGVDNVEIASGLKEGEQVITEGADRLKDGAHVMLPGDKPSFGNGNGPGKGKGKHGQWQGPQGQQGQAQGQAAEHGQPPAAAAAAPAAGTSDAERREAWRKRRQQQQQSGGQ